MGGAESERKSGAQTRVCFLFVFCQAPKCAQPRSVGGHDVYNVRRKTGEWLKHVSRGGGQAAYPKPIHGPSHVCPPRPIWTIPKCGRGSPICVYLDPLFFFFFKHKQHIALGWGAVHTHRAPSGASQRSSLFFGHGTCSVSSNVRQCRFETQTDTCLHVISQWSLQRGRAVAMTTVPGALTFGIATPYQARVRTKKFKGRGTKTHLQGRENSYRKCTT